MDQTNKPTIEMKIMGELWKKKLRLKGLANVEM
jgi:hypothetical protein